MERRRFIKSACSLCILIGSGMLAGELTGCASQPTYKTTTQNNTIIVPLSLFAASEIQIIQPEHFVYNIALRKHSNGSFSALVLRCTHADNPLTFAGNTYRCSLHGSTFDVEGDVIRGPAQLSLPVLRTELSGDTILILLK
jgi:Rieske Fe-S protein